MPSAEERQKPQYSPGKLAEKFHLTDGEARLVLAASGKDRKAAKEIAIDLAQSQE
jgi:hypothetical protein